MRVLVIGDIHCPVDHPGYLYFCSDLYDQWDCDHVVFIGDLADNHAISFHAKNPQCPGPSDEYELTLECIQEWNKVFPVADVCIGNHDDLILRQAETISLPAKYLRNFAEIWDTPDWDWDYEFMIDDAIYLHGTGRSGVHPAWNALPKKMKSVVMGHCHSRSGVKWKATRQERFFAMDTGCGIDVEAFQFAYGKHIDERPILSAGVVIDGVPFVEPMPMGSKEKYHRSRF
jgi:predicted phosphodiesterase